MIVTSKSITHHRVTGHSVCVTAVRCAMNKETDRFISAPSSLAKSASYDLSYEISFRHASSSISHPSQKSAALLGLPISSCFCIFAILVLANLVPKPRAGILNGNATPAILKIDVVGAIFVERFAIRRSAERPFFFLLMCVRTVNY